VRAGVLLFLLGFFEGVLENQDAKTWLFVVVSVVVSAKTWLLAGRFSAAKIFLYFEVYFSTGGCKLCHFPGDASNRGFARMRGSFAPLRMTTLFV
jgi:hypothetical protein